jgi:UDP-N-acetylmuramoyl-L-alanyl-D-glutamate--2,6-diaminopimelate ligase
MKLRELLNGLADCPAALGEAEIAGISADSRELKAGEVFVALSGTKSDGTSFVEQALAKGAVAVIGDHLPANAKTIHVDNARRVLALAAARLYPHQPDTIVAVTGTSGKTSVAAFTQQIWAHSGHLAASLGTIGVVAPSRTSYGSLTTPDPVGLHRAVDELATKDKVTHLVVEASSHGLHQHRLDGLRISAGAFTNLSRDHMDYHPTVEDYFAAKLRLFSELLQPGGAAVVAADHEEAARVIAASKARGLRIMTVGRKGETIRLRNVGIEGFSQRIDISHEGRDQTLMLPLVGAFQIENALVAAALAIATGSDAARVFATLEDLHGAPGRLERVGERNGAPIFIDYAHKPDALAKALDALKPFAKRRLVVVFGCGGDRDAGKRPLMGEIAVAKADDVIITDDNPRSENPAAIRAAILAAAPRAREIGDRAAAIRTAVAQLQDGDVLLIAGKGHETGQIVGSRVLPFSDHEAVAAALEGKVA